MSTQGFSEQLQKTFGNTIDRYLEFNQSHFKPSETLKPTISKQPSMDAGLVNKLQTTIISAFNQSWNVPMQTSSLSTDEIHFLQNLTVEHLSTAPSHKPNPFLNFCIQVFQATVSQYITSKIQEGFGEQKNNKEVKVSSQLEKDASNDTQNKSYEKTSQKKFEHHSSIESGSSLEPKHTFTGSVSTDKIDPSIETMKKIATSEIVKKIQKATQEELGKFAKEIGDTTAFDRAYKALAKGKTMEQAAQIANEAIDANKAFIKHVGHSLAAAVKTGAFLTKVEELGWDAAIVETAKATTLSFLSKGTARIATTLVGCTNPVWCAGVVSSIIADTFISQETAPMYHDMYPNKTLPNLQESTQSRLPSLQPLYPTLSPTKNQ